MISFRLGGEDGVAVEAAKWAGALGLLGWTVRSVAGAGSVDVVLPGLAMDAPEPPTRAEVDGALADADLVIVENLCSLPLNPGAAAVVAAACAGRPTILHHHDLPWQRPHLAHLPPPPDDAAWAHVTINELSRAELATRGMEAMTIYNAFDPDPPPGDRAGVRTALGVPAGTTLLLQPTRALGRKNIGGAIALAEALDATYWLLGPAEDGYGPELERLTALARCPVVLGTTTGGCSIADAYAACDAVALPSLWEGFGNPSVESATHRRPLAIGPYPVATELQGFGFRWFDAADPAPLARWLDRPDARLIAHNQQVAAEHFNLADLPDRLSEVLRRVPGP
jgi:glycosyltransferase involved in cell wall biosynthesis